MLESFSEVEDIIGYKFKDKNLLIRAFTHNSGVKRVQNVHIRTLNFWATAYFRLSLPRR